MFVHKLIDVRSRARRVALVTLLGVLAGCGGGSSGGGTAPVAPPPGEQVLTVSTAGSGLVSSSPVGIDCGTVCSKSFPPNTVVMLQATPQPGWTFAGWTGAACPGTQACTVTMTAAVGVTAAFTAITHPLTAAVVGSGSINSAPAGIACPADCNESYAEGATVTLNAVAAAGHQFDGWSGSGCTGTGSCVVPMTAARSVSAAFSQTPPNLRALQLSVTGLGSVASIPAGIACGSDCTESYVQGTPVTLAATPSAGWIFAGWSGGGCSGLGTCVVAMNQPLAVTASFTQVTRLLSVTLAGQGAVTSTTPGVACGVDCTEAYPLGQVVTLNAVPAANWAFTGWGGGCAGTGPCVVTMNAAVTVTATFTPLMHLLTVGRTGSGTVTSAPAGISCGADCSEALAQGTSVTLTATPAAGSTFAGWSGGGCTGTASCVVQMSAATTVTAAFSPVMHLLTVARSGSGSVTSSPAGINCGADCSEAYLQASVVTLVAAAAANNTFGGWGGACTGTGNCSVTMGAARNVTATFAPTASFGLATRPNNQTCFALNPPTGSTASLTLQLPFPALPAFAQPVAMLQAPNDSTRWFVVEKSGVVRVFANSGAVASSSVFADITALVRTAGEEEAGLLGMAFDPNFGTGAGKNRNIYLFYSAAPNSGYRLRSTVSRFTADATLTSVASSSEVKLMGLDKLESNHNGGNLAFGPDGYLYIGFGDGGGAPNPEAQDDRFLFGKILRINPAASTGPVAYAIPPDNPNAGGPLCNATGRGASACGEVWARGLRNPWRWSFDRATGRLWAGDVGWGSYEEVNIVTRNANYGWPITEGPACVTPGCNKSGLTDPVHSVARGDGQSITGGYVYRGTQTTDLRGQYVFSDFGSKMFGAVIAGSTPGAYTGRTLIAPFAAASIMTSSFGEANDGELYALDYGSGRIRKLAFSTGTGGGVVAPTQLSATGCVDPADPRLPAPGLVGYEINAPFWSDSADKTRHFALPASPASFVAGADGDWAAPPGAVLMKTFRLGAQLVETRLLMQQSNGDWAGYTYEWNVAQNDATLVSPAGKDKVIGALTWSFPSQSQCLQCHTSAAGFTLGLEHQQLNRNTLYPQTGNQAQQLTTLSRPVVGLLTPEVTSVTGVAKLSDPAGLDPTVDRARAYLHTNCSMCHRPGGPTPVGLNLLAATPLAATNTCNLDPTRGTLGLPNAKIIAPGLPDSSVLLARMASRDPTIQMPPIGSHLVDAQGVALLRSWITGLSNCN